MIGYILFIMIGLKLNVLNGWYLALVITGIITKLISLLCEVFKLGKQS